MKSSKKFGTVLALLPLSIGCDQLLKYVAELSLKDSLPVSLLWDFIRLQYAENRGMMLSIGASLPPTIRFWAFIVLVGLLLLGMSAYVVWSRTMHSSQLVGWTLVIAGGLGNLIDRLARDGAVIDYVSIGIGVVRTAVFNLADALVFAGVFLLLIRSSKKDATVVDPEPHHSSQESIRQPEQES